MAKRIYLFTVLFTVFISCKQEMVDKIADFQGELVVLKSCSGIFLKQNGLLYKVCNRQLVESYENGQVIKVTLSTIPQCNIYNYTECGVAIGFTGWVQVVSIQ